MSTSIATVQSASTRRVETILAASAILFIGITSIVVFMWMSKNHNSITGLPTFLEGPLKILGMNAAIFTIVYKLNSNNWSSRLLNNFSILYLAISTVAISVYCGIQVFEKENAPAASVTTVSQSAGTPVEQSENMTITDIEKFVGKFDRYFTCLEGKQYRSSEDFEALFANKNVCLRNDFSLHAKPYTGPAEYYDELRAIFNYNPLTHNRKIAIGEKGSFLCKKITAGWYVYIKKLISYRYGRSNHHRYFKGWERLEIQDIPRAGLKIVSAIPANPPTDDLLIGQEIPDNSLDN